MPQTQRRALTRRVQTTPQDTYDVTTPSLDVVASPVDPYIQPQVGSGLRSLVQALAPMSEGLRAYAQELDRRWQEEFEQGQLARATGRLLPESASEAMFRGYQAIDGELAALRDYRAELTHFVSENIDTMTPDEFEEGLRQIAQKYIEGGTEDYIKAFVSKALPMEDAVIAQYHARQAELLRQNAFDKLSQKASDEARFIVESIAAPLFNLGSLEELAGNVTAYDVLNRANFGVVFSERIWEGLQTAIEAGKALGFSEQEVTEVYLDRVGALAVDLGLPELLEFAEKRDDEGVSIAGGALGDKVRRYREEARRARNTYIELAERQAAELREQETLALINQAQATKANLWIMEDRFEAAKQARNLRMMLTSDPRFMQASPSLVNSILSDLVEIEQGAFQFPSVGNEQVFADLYMAGLAFNSLTIEEIEAARREGELTLSQYQQLVRLYQEQEERKRVESLRWPDEGAIRTVTDSFLSLLSDINEWGQPENRDVVASFQFYIADEINKFRQANGRNPSFSEYMNQILEPTLRLFGLDMREVLRYTGEVDRPSILTEEPPGPEIEEPAPLNYWQRMVNWVAERLPFVEPPYVQGEPVVLYPGALYTEEEAFEKLSLAFSRGSTKQQIEQILRDSLGEREDAINFYFRLYAFNFAKRVIEDPQYVNDPVRAVRDITNTLRHFGFTDAEIQEAIDGVRFVYRGEVVEEQNGAE